MTEQQQKQHEIDLGGLDYYLQQIAKQNVGSLEVISEFGKRPMDYEQTLAFMRADCGYSKEFIDRVRNVELNSLRTPGIVSVFLDKPADKLSQLVEWIEENQDDLIDSAGEHSTHVPIDRILAKAKLLQGG